MTSFLHNFIKTNTSRIFLLNGDLEVFALQDKNHGQTQAGWERCLSSANSKKGDCEKGVEKELAHSRLFSRKKSFRNEYLWTKESYTNSIKIILVPVSPWRSSFVYPEVPPTQESQGSKSRKWSWILVATQHTQAKELAL